MRPTPLQVEYPIEVSLIQWMQAQSERPALTFPDVSQSYVPVQGLLASAIVHQLVMVAILLLSFTVIRTRLPGSRAFKETIPLSVAKVIYLPVLGGGAEGHSHAGFAPGTASKASSAPSRSSQGQAYPGPQLIVSHPQNPTNQQQTIIQAAEQPRILQQFVPLPDMMKIAKPKLRLPPDLVSGKPDLPEFHPAVQPPAKPLKVALPTTPPPAPIRPAPEKPRRAAGEKEVEPPKLDKAPMLGLDEQALVSLSSTPTLPQQTPEIPPGEARGRFAVSPNVILAPVVAPGSKIEGTTTAAAIGQSAATVGDAVGETAVDPGAGTGGPASGGGSGLENGAGVEKGSSKGGLGSKSVRASGDGVGKGTGPGAMTGSGAGAGSGAGKGGPLGLTIQGGSYGGSGASVGDSRNVGEISISAKREVSLPPQRAYGITINSTADSGGGLPDLGVFAHEKVYTVFLDMRSNTLDRAPSWTLQYARLRSAEEIKAGDASSPGQEGLTPPFLMVRDAPKFRPELIRSYLGEVIVVYAVMDTQGKLQSLSVKQSPDIRFNPAILAVLSHWIFQPAQLNGQAVALKVLIGIPLLPYE